MYGILLPVPQVVRGVTWTLQLVVELETRSFQTLWLNMQLGSAGLHMCVVDTSLGDGRRDRFCGKTGASENYFRSLDILCMLQPLQLVGPQFWKEMWKFGLQMIALLKHSSLIIPMRAVNERAIGLGYRRSWFSYRHSSQPQTSRSNVRSRFLNLRNK